MTSNIIQPESFTIENLNVPNSDVEWLCSKNVSDYDSAVTFMENRALEIRAGIASECVWLVEHSPLYTGGTSAQDSDILQPAFPVYKSGRGGQYTYHGTGQRTAYVMVDLKKRGFGIKEYVTALEQWIIESLAPFSIDGQRRCGRVGIWVETGNGYEDKIAAIGVRVKKWVSYYGIAININPDMSHFNGIVPCGISDRLYGVTSFEKLGIDATLADIDKHLIKHFDSVFSAK